MIRYTRRYGIVSPLMDCSAVLAGIRQHAAERVNVQDLQHAISISPRTPLDELHRLRVQHARDMLSRGDSTVH